MENDIINDYVNGQSVNFITKKYHCGKQRVTKILLKNNIKIRNKRVFLTNEDECKIVRLYNEKIEISEIEKMFSVSKKKIYNILHRHDVVRNLNKKISTDTKSKIYSDFVNNTSLENLAEKYDLNIGTVRRFLKENGVVFDKTPHNKIVDEIKEKIVLEYTNGLNVCELHEKYGYGTTTIARWVKSAGKTRSLSDAFTLSAKKGRKHFRGTDLPWFSSKNKKWFIADSMWEAVRMQQLDLDANVIWWEKCTERIPYVDKNGKGHYYVPDFKVGYEDKIVVEEIKPSTLTESEINQTKFNAAKKYYFTKNIEYKILTEKEIGLDDINNFRPGGILQYTQEVRRERRRIQRNERLKRQRKEKRDAENRNR